MQAKCTEQHFVPVEFGNVSCRLRPVEHEQLKSNCTVNGQTEVPPASISFEQSFEFENMPRSHTFFKCAGPCSSRSRMALISHCPQLCDLPPEVLSQVLTHCTAQWWSIRQVNRCLKLAVANVRLERWDLLLVKATAVS